MQYFNALMTSTQLQRRHNNGAHTAPPLTTVEVDSLPVQLVHDERSGRAPGRVTRDQCRVALRGIDVDVLQVAWKLTQCWKHKQVAGIYCERDVYS